MALEHRNKADCKEVSSAEARCCAAAWLDSAFFPERHSSTRGFFKPPSWRYKCICRAFVLGVLAGVGRGWDNGLQVDDTPTALRVSI